jgi:ankyrin repeat protein
LFNEDFVANNIDSKEILDKLVYLYKKYNFFVFNDIESILFILSACGSVEEFSVFYQIFKQKYTNYYETLKKIYIISIIYDNFNVFNFLNNKEKRVTKNINKETFVPILFFALVYGSVKIVNYFINEGIDINVKDNKEKRTALMWAVIFNRIEVVKLLIEKGAKIDEKDINMRGEKDNTALMLAIHYNRTEVVKLLLDKITEDSKNIKNEKELKEYNDKHLNVTNIKKMTPLILSAYYGRTEIVKLLLDKITENAKYIKDEKELKEYNDKYLNAIDTDVKTALIWASKNNNVGALKLILDKIIENRKYIKDEEELEKYNNKYLNAKDSDGKTALIYASENGYTKIIELLIDSGADINKKDGEYGKTPIMWAMKNKELGKEVVELLIKKGARLDKTSNDGGTVLMYAVLYKQIEIVELLINIGVDLNEKDNYGFTALMTAVHNRYTNIAEFLIKRGADINQKDNKGRTALMWAADYNSVEIVELLLKNGAKVDDTDNEGKTALDYAKKDEIKKLLLEAMEKQKQQEQNKS